jgi:hypothetical protein
MPAHHSEGFGIGADAKLIGWSSRGLPLAMYLRLLRLSFHITFRARKSGEHRLLATTDVSPTVRARLPVAYINPAAGQPALVFWHTFLQSLPGETVPMSYSTKERADSDNIVRLDTNDFVADD